MSKEKFEEELIGFLNEQIKNEHDKRYKMEKYLRSVVLQGIEDNVDALPDIEDKTRAIYVSEHVEYAYRHILNFIHHNM